MSPIKILVIEDDPVIIHMNERLLGEKGYQVITARDGLEGIDRALDEKPDVILLDIILPRMHGFEVCKLLKLNPATGHIPIIYLTGTGLEEVAQNEPEIKAQGYIAKPYDINALDNLIQEVLKKNH